MDMKSLEQQIQNLTSAVEVAQSGKHVDWAETWTHIKSINCKFKETSFPSRTEHQRTWSLFQEAVASVKAEQNRQRSRIKRLSSSHLWHINELVHAAEADNGLGELTLAVLSGGLYVVYKDIKNKVVGRKDEVYEELQRRNKLLREAGQYLSTHKFEMLREDKNAAHALINSKFLQLREAWSRWESALQESKAERHQAYLQRQAKRDAWEASQRKWRDNQDSYIAKLERALENLGEWRAKVLTHIDDLKEKRDTARSESFRATVSEWISKEELKVEETEEKMRDVANKLSEAKRKIGLN